MIRVLLAACTGLAIVLVMVLLRLDTVSLERDGAVKVAKQLAASVDSLRGTLRLQRELASDQAAIESTFLKEKQRAEDEAERLRRCLADGTCGLRIAATCVRVDGTATTASSPDAASPRLTAAAERAYPALVAGLKTQRAQITGLQQQLITLHAKCKIGG